MATLYTCDCDAIKALLPAKYLQYLIQSWKILSQNIRVSLLHFTCKREVHLEEFCDKILLSFRDEYVLLTKVAREPSPRLNQFRIKMAKMKWNFAPLFTANERSSFPSIHILAWSSYKYKFSIVTACSVILLNFRLLPRALFFLLLNFYGFEKVGSKTKTFTFFTIVWIF